MNQRIHGPVAAKFQPARQWWGWFTRLPAPVIYLISVVASKAISLITLPLMAAYLPPAEYGNYDVIASFAECIVLIFGLAIGATLIRFASTAKTEEKSRQCARELIGTALCIGVVFGLPAVLFAPLVMDQLGVSTHHAALRLLIAGTVVAAMIELPLFWLRLKNRAVVFFLVVMARTLGQAFLVWLMLTNGFGVPGLMAGNGAALLCLAVVLLALQIRDTGIAVSYRALKQICIYGLPIVGAELAMFALGNCNRLFMPGHIAPDAIAHFGLAMRIALVSSLAIAPFELWWFPKRIAALSQPGGIEKGARMWGIGVGITILSATCLALAGPILVRTLFPQSYAGAIAFIAPLIVIQSLHVITLFTNVGSYARPNGSYVFGIEVGCAMIALVGYIFLIPAFGPSGVLMAMGSGQLCRFLLHLLFGRELAPLPYPWLPAFVTIGTAIVLVSISPPHDWMIWRILYTIGSLGLLSVIAFLSGLMKPPANWADRVTGLMGR